MKLSAIFPNELLFLSHSKYPDPTNLRMESPLYLEHISPSKVWSWQIVRLSLFIYALHTDSQFIESSDFAVASSKRRLVESESSLDWRDYVTRHWEWQIVRDPSSPNRSTENHTIFPWTDIIILRQLRKFWFCHILWHFFLLFTDYSLIPMNWTNRCEKGVTQWKIVTNFEYGSLCLRNLVSIFRDQVWSLRCGIHVIFLISRLLTSWNSVRWARLPFLGVSVYSVAPFPDSWRMRKVSVQRSFALSPVS
jgi:hypothetical protein